MQLSSRILGAHIVSALQQHHGAAVLVIGADKFTRAQLSHIGCFNFMAAQRLTAAMTVLGVRSTKEVFETIPPSALVLPGVGAIALAVLGAAFEAKRIGGTQPLEAWVTRHRAKDASREFVTFHTMKTQEAKREAGEKKARKQRAARQHARRNVAQRLRVDRLMTRHQTGAAPRGEATTH